MFTQYSFKHVIITSISWIPLEIIPFAQKSGKISILTLCLTQRTAPFLGATCRHVTVNWRGSSVQDAAKIGNLYVPGVAGAFDRAFVGNGNIGGALDTTAFHAAAA